MGKQRLQVSLSLEWQRTQLPVHDFLLASGKKYCTRNVIMRRSQQRRLWLDVGHIQLHTGRQRQAWIPLSTYSQKEIPLVFSACITYMGEGYQ